MDLHNELLAMREAMTPTSRAEKVARETVKLLEIWKGKPAEYQMAVANVTKALEDYAREAVEKANDLNRREIEIAHRLVEGVKLVNDNILDVAKEAREEGAASMRERAAKDAYALPSTLNEIEGILSEDAHTRDRVAWVQLRTLSAPSRWEKWSPRMDKLKPCPFCGSSKNVEFIPIEYKYRGEYEAVWCRSCVAIGPQRSSEQNAVIAWNCRAGVEGEKGK